MYRMLLLLLLSREQVDKSEKLCQVLQKYVPTRYQMPYFIWPFTAIRYRKNYIAKLRDDDESDSLLCIFQIN